MGRKQQLLPMPSPRKTYSFHFPALNGGLNLRDEEINLKDNESPEMENLWWQDGVLEARPGQERMSSSSQYGAGSYTHSFSSSAIPYAATTFQEGVVVHIGASLYTWHGTWRQLRHIGVYGYSTVQNIIPLNAGTFFRFGKNLYYKNTGGFFKLMYNSAHSFLETPFEISYVAHTTYSTGYPNYRSITNSAFVPTILINADPATGSGDTYQPENALSPRKCVTYNASTIPSTVVRSGDGMTRAFSMGVTSAQNLRGVQSVYINDAYTESALYSFDVRTGTVIFNTAPEDDATITFTLDIGNLEYHLPVESVDSVTEVKVDGLTYREGQDYTVDTVAGIVTFTNAPPVTNPPTNNTVSITYSKANDTAKNAIMNCPYAAVYGTGKDLCVIVGGNPSAPNTIYWSGSTQNGPDISYWPVTHYNMADDEITGFGRQYDQMFVFQKNRIGKLDMTTESIEGRDTISLTYSGVNDGIGCDLPRSIQLIENNLTFANTSGGVYQILSASAALENNVQCISEKINGSDIRPGLLRDLTVAGSGPVCSLDDGKRYWLSVNGHVWLWDYSISRNSNPVWFFFTGMTPYALSMRDKKPCLFNANRETVTLCGQVFSDFGNAVRKVYQFPVRNFGGYDRLKDVLTILFSLRSDTPSDTTVIYETDYETRADPVNLTVAGYDRLTDRNLEVRDLSVPRHAAVFRREPRCLNVRHFALRLENNTAGNDLNVNYVEIQVRYAGKFR